MMLLVFISGMVVGGTFAALMTAVLMMSRDE